MAFELKSDPRMEEKFAAYPEHILPKLLDLRALIIDTAEGIEGLHVLEETLKWGEPSYLAKKGSTLRFDWKEKTPDQYAIYFKCTSKLVPTFREVFGNQLNYENNRAILLKLDEQLPEALLKKCIGAALQYHKLKSLPALGMFK